MSPVWVRCIIFILLCIHNVEVHIFTKLTFIFTFIRLWLFGIWLIRWHALQIVIFYISKEYFHHRRITNITIHTILFCLCIFQLDVVSCLSIVVGPFLMLCPVLCNVSCTYVLWFLHGKDVPLFMWCVCWIVLWLLQKLFDNWLCCVWHLIRWRP